MKIALVTSGRILFHTLKISNIYCISYRNIIMNIYEDKPSSLFNRGIFSAAADRNKEPISEILAKHLPALAKKLGEPLNCLEISSGSGQHVTYFANIFTNTIWQPSEYDEAVLNHIRSRTLESKLANILEPVQIDASAKPCAWPVQGKDFEVMYVANLLHISPIQCTHGLMAAAGVFLKKGGLLFIYGPFAQGGKITPESNVQFDESLKNHDSNWGLRDIEFVSDLGIKNGLTLEDLHDMPSNNKTLVFRRLDL